MVHNHPVTPMTKAHALTRLSAKLDRVIALATASSSAITRWRLILFIVGAICTIARKMGWYQTGNGTLIVFIALFLTVAVYHNRRESRLHRLRPNRSLVHLARPGWIGIIFLLIRRTLPITIPMPKT
jgi:hypothetical protein